MSYTKGPWITESSATNGIACVATADNSLEICEVWGNENDGISIDAESLANAQLISAAPDLLEALDEMCAEFRGYDLPYGSAAYQKAISAISKARSAS